MDPSEDGHYARCGSCNMEVTLGDRVYQFGSDGALCFDCARERQGVYQEWLERWTVLPNVDDLLQRSPGES